MKRTLASRLRLATLVAGSLLGGTTVLAQDAFRIAGIVPLSGAWGIV
jgi:hypothetical protein